MTSGKGLGGQVAYLKCGTSVSGNPARTQQDLLEKWV